MIIDQQTESIQIKDGKEKEFDGEWEYDYEYDEEGEIDDTHSESESVNTLWDTPSDTHWLPPDLEFKYILRMVYCLFFSNLFLNMDMGILPAGSLDIK